MDVDGVPLLYQVIAVYRGRMKASLVNSYGDYLGLHQLEDLEYAGDGPLFSKKDYDIGSSIIWIDGEDVYEGIIDYLYDPYARVVNVKKLMPVDYVSNVPYWKISEGRNSDGEYAKIINNNIIGYDLNKRRD